MSRFPSIMGGLAALALALPAAATQEAGREVLPIKIGRREGRECA